MGKDLAEKNNRGVFVLWRRVVFLETLQNSLNMPDMFCSLRENQNDIKINIHKLVKHISETVINDCFNYGWSMSETKRHHQIFKGAKGNPKGCFPLIALLDQMVCCDLLVRWKWWLDWKAQTRSRWGWVDSYSLWWCHFVLKSMHSRMVLSFLSTN